MRITLKPASIIYRISIASTTLVILGIFTLIQPPSVFWVALLVVLFTALLYNFSSNLVGREAHLIHLLTISSGLLFGPVIAGWATISGIATGCILRRLLYKFAGQRAIFPKPQPLDPVFAMGLQVLPLVLLFSLPPFNSQLSGIEPSTSGDWSSVIGFLVLYTILHSSLYILDILLRNKRNIILYNRELVILGSIEILPLPFVLMALAANNQIGEMTIVFLGGIATILAILVSGFSGTRLDLERRVQDLSTLNQISRVLRSPLNLENLLTEIQVQVTQLLKINNFYVALYNENEKNLWYPLAVKNGQRQDWAPRPLMIDRLTDRVIHAGEQILLSPKTTNELVRVGLPLSEETPNAWMGVPLITSDKTIGCLAVFSLTPETEFTEADLNLLSILSGQVSVAIENALLYQQAQSRAIQLETLNRISALITASLDQQEVFTQVCRSVTEVGGSQHSAIFLLDPEKGQVFLAYAYNLSSQFASKNATFSITHKHRLRCLRTGEPVLSSLLTISPLQIDVFDPLKEEGIQAFGEFPLTTPDGQIGFLAVYYDSPHTFPSEEVDLLQTFASQAALAVSNARLYSNVDTALSRRAYQLTILEAVGRELAAAIGSERLFEMILNYALEFTSSPWGELSLYNPQSRILEVKASWGFDNPRKQFNVKDGLVGQAVSHQKIINIGDVRQESKYLDYSNGVARSLLSVPLIHEGRVLGVMAIESPHLNAYTSNDESFISQLATQAAVAVVNAELYNETQRRLREQSILYLVSTHLMGNPGLENVMQTLNRSMEAALPSPSVGVYLWDDIESSYTSHYSTVSGLNPDCRMPELIPYADLESLHPSLVKTGPLRISPRRGNELLGECTECQALVFPLIANKQRLGMVLLHTAKSQVVQEEELQLLRAIVAQVSISLQNALLFADVMHHRDRMDAILNSVDEGILMIDTHGHILLANEFIMTIMGRTREELANRRLASLSENALRALGYTSDEAENLIGSLGQSGTASFPKSILKTADNKPERVLERSTSPVWGESGRLIGWMIVLRDVTEEHQISQARELITSTLVHDLRSPVSAVLSAVDIIDESLPASQQSAITYQALRVAHNSANRVLAMIESLLDIARMQAGKMELNLAQVNVNTLVINCLGEFINQGTEYGIILRNETPENLPPICADQSKLTRVLTNLIDNALKFTPAGGQVVIKAELKPGKAICLEISDTGPGIPDEYSEKIFERFIQIPGQRGRRRGSGLGLTFCKMAIEAHNGRIWVSNKLRPESGCIFSVLLPLEIERETLIER
jgi:PAS domain S-box-containing protein